MSVKNPPKYTWASTYLVGGFGGVPLAELAGELMLHPRVLQTEMGWWQLSEEGMCVKKIQFRDSHILTS